MNLEKEKWQGRTARSRQKAPGGAVPRHRHSRRARVTAGAGEEGQHIRYNRTHVPEVGGGGSRDSAGGSAKSKTEGEGALRN